MAKLDTLPHCLIRHIARRLSWRNQSLLMHTSKALAEAVGPVRWGVVRVSPANKQVYTNYENELTTSFLLQIIINYSYNVMQWTRVLDLGVVRDDWLVALGWIPVICPKLQELHIAFADLEHFYRLEDDLALLDLSYDRINVHLKLGITQMRLTTRLNLARYDALKTVGLFAITCEEISCGMLGGLPNKVEVLKLCAESEHYYTDRVLSSRLTAFWRNCPYLTTLYLRDLNITIENEDWFPSSVSELHLARVKTTLRVDRLIPTGVRSLRLDHASVIHLDMPKIQQVDFLNVELMGQTQPPVDLGYIAPVPVLRCIGELYSIKALLKMYRYLPLHSIYITYYVQAHAIHHKRHHHGKNQLVGLCRMIDRNFPLLEKAKFMLYQTQNSAAQDISYLSDHLVILVKELVLAKPPGVLNVKLQWKGPKFPQFRVFCKLNRVCAEFQSADGIHYASFANWERESL